MIGRAAEKAEMTLSPAFERGAARTQLFVALAELPAAAYPLTAVGRDVGQRLDILWRCLEII